MTATDITTVIDHIAKKLEVPANKLMTLAPQLGVADVIGTGICFLIALLLGSITALCIYMMWKHEEWRDGDTPSIILATVLVFSGIFTLLSTLGTLVQLPSTLLWLYNPEVWLLHKVVHF